MKFENILKTLKDYIGILLMNIIMFIILFFLIPLLMDKVNPNIWRLLFVLTIIAITDLFYLTKWIKYEHVLASLPILFILNLIFLGRCERLDLYGITSHGGLDKSPAIIDALLVDMIIVFGQYITLFVTRACNNIIKKQDSKKKMKGKKI